MCWEFSKTYHSAQDPDPDTLDPQDFGFLDPDPDLDPDPRGKIQPKTGKKTFKKREIIKISPFLNCSSSFKIK